MMTLKQATATLLSWLKEGKLQVTKTAAAQVLGCKPESLLASVEAKGNLGSVDYSWVGGQLRISTMSLMRYVTGGYSLKDIFSDGIPEPADINPDEEDRCNAEETVGLPV